MNLQADSLQCFRDSGLGNLQQDSTVGHSRETSAVGHSREAAVPNPRDFFVECQLEGLPEFCAGVRQPPSFFVGVPECGSAQPTPGAVSLECPTSEFFLECPPQSVRGVPSPRVSLLECPTPEYLYLERVGMFEVNYSFCFPHPRCGVIRF